MPVRNLITHQYIERKTGNVKTEHLVFDQGIHIFYSTAREHASFLYKLLISRQISSLLGFLMYDFPCTPQINRSRRLLSALKIDIEELFEPMQHLNTCRSVFERKICYWHCRPMTDVKEDIVSPADARMICGSFCHPAPLFLKEKFFSYTELIGQDKHQWLNVFQNGAYAIFRLTPDKYHYNHSPVSGQVVDIYEISGKYHSCNPGAVVQSVTPYSKNLRVITVIDTDVDGGSRIGLVMMIEIVALMIGSIVQCYSDTRYDEPQPVQKGLFMKKGQPKSLFRPGSSTVVLIFQKGKITFSRDLLKNQLRTNVQSRFTRGFDTPLVETDIPVRETIGKKIG